MSPQPWAEVAAEAPGWCAAAFRRRARKEPGPTFDADSDYRARSFRTATDRPDPALLSRARAPDTFESCLNRLTCLLLILASTLG
jgi:hypothetical protein